MSTVQPSVSGTVQQYVNDKAIYNDVDSRYNLHDIADLGMSPEYFQAVTERSRSVACLILKTAITAENGNYHLFDQSTLVAQIGLKPDQRFANEPAPGYGTAFLISPKLMVTAAHCFCKKGSDEINNEKMKNSYVVFDFRMNSTGCTVDFPKETVYTIERIVAHKWMRGSKWSDWAVFELNGEVRDRKPLTLDFTNIVKLKTPLYMIGHPVGLPEKYTEGAEVKDCNHADYFETDLDAFGGNSGSPVFHQVYHSVVGILISGNKDFDPGKIVHHVTNEEIAKKGFEKCQKISVCAEIKNILNT